MNRCFSLTHLPTNGRWDSGVVAVSTPLFGKLLGEPGLRRGLFHFPGAYFTPNATGNSRKACCTVLLARGRYCTGVLSTSGSTAK